MPAVEGVYNSVLFLTGAGREEHSGTMLPERSLAIWYMHC